MLPGLLQKAFNRVLKCDDRIEGKEEVGHEILDFLRIVFDWAKPLTMQPHQEMGCRS